MTVAFYAAKVDMQKVTEVTSKVIDRFESLFSGIYLGEGALTLLLHSFTRLKNT